MWQEKNPFSSAITLFGEIRTGLVKFRNPPAKPFSGVAWESHCRNPRTAPSRAAVAPALLLQAGHQRGNLGVGMRRHGPRTRPVSKRNQGREAGILGGSRDPRGTWHMSRGGHAACAQLRKQQDADACAANALCAAMNAEEAKELMVALQDDPGFFLSFFLQDDERTP